MLTVLPHFGLRRQSEATTALFHSGVILRCIKRQMIANAREAEQRKSGVALRFPPHSKMPPTSGDGECVSPPTEHFQDPAGPAVIDRATETQHTIVSFAVLWRV